VLDISSDLAVSGRSYHWLASALMLAPACGPNFAHVRGDLSFQNMNAGVNVDDVCSTFDQVDVATMGAAFKGSSHRFRKHRVTVARLP
jgi:hypothetical protein